MPFATRPAVAHRLSLLLALLAIGPMARAEEGAAVAPKPRFDVWEYRVEGNTVLEPLTIERTVYPLLGPGKTIDDVNAARESLEKAYRDAGYPTVFVDVPEQDVAGGLVRLGVTEGRVSRLKITGARYYSNGWIRAQLPEATPGTIPRIDAFQSELRALNGRTSDRLLTPVLRPGAEPGTVEVEVKVQDKLPVNGALEINNRNTAGTTESRVEASVRYDNLWQRDHSFGLQYQVAPQDRSETEVIAASYVLRPMASATAFAFYALTSDSDIATVGGDINVIGKGSVYGARAILPLQGSPGFYQGLQLGVDYKDFDETIGFNTEGDEDIVTPISYLNWSVAWNGSMPAEKASQGFSLTANFGIRGLGNEPQEFADKRFKARPNYFYVEGGYDRLQSLPWWNTSLAVAVHGQLTPQPLISNEQFSAGGSSSVRGYYEGEVLGDYGLQASLEWRSASLGERGGRHLASLYGYAFIDGARLLLNDPLPGQLADATLVSAGLGLRLPADPLTAGLDLALPLKDGSTTQRGEERLLFSVRYGF